ncbi:class I SAM-dependent DNA methyltransferase [Paenibacillus gansuensis]|uniref:Class I SAM-dependent DNA methyltransferase n=1 Tax=Paenibacillus gansuensis TaxID=306542 RepID=A0ABW5PE01_9BACL
MSYGSFAFVYDRLMEDMPYPEWVRFAEECFRLHSEGQLFPSCGKGSPSASLVDLGCGTGSVTLPLAEKGYSITGIDLSEEMLSVARRRQDEAGASPSAVQWIQQDMREWELAGKTDAVISFCDCLNYLLEESDILQTFQRTCEGLREGGLFLFDVHHPNQLVRYYENQPFTLNLEDVAYLWYCDYHEDRMQIEHDLTIFAADPEDPASFRRIDEIHTQRAYEPEWLKARLLEAGFRDVRVSADFTFDPPGEDSERVFFAAVK